MNAQIIPFKPLTPAQAAMQGRLDAALADGLTRPIHSLCCARRQLDDVARIAGQDHADHERLRTLIETIDDVCELAHMLQISHTAPPQREGL